MPKELDGYLPAVGDVLEMFDDPEAEHPFGTAIVTKVHEAKERKDIRIDFERVHMHIFKGEVIIGVQRVFNVNPFDYKFYHDHKNLPVNRTWNWP